MVWKRYMTLSNSKMRVHFILANLSFLLLMLYHDKIEMPINWYSSNVVLSAVVSKQVNKKRDFESFQSGNHCLLWTAAVLLFLAIKSSMKSRLTCRTASRADLQNLQDMSETSIIQTHTCANGQVLAFKLLFWPTSPNQND